MRIPGGHWVFPGRVHRAFRLSMAVLLAVLLYPWIGTAATAMPTQQSTVTVAVVPADTSKAAGDQFEISIEVTGVMDLGAFELSLRYDAALVQVDKATLGEFIGSTERTVVPLGPNIEAAEGRLVIGAITTGTDAGAEGQGVLATLSFTALRAGTGTLQLEAVRLSDTKGQPIAAAAADGSVRFTGSTVVPTATPAPVTPTATLIPLPPTATLVPIATAVPPSPSPSATETPAPTQTAVPATATPAETLEPLETRILKVASATVQAWQTEAASWTATPTATATPEPTATPAPTATPNPATTAEPGAATSVSSPVAFAATPVASNAPQSQSGAGLVVGLGAAAVALGAGGVYLWRRGRPKNT